MIVHNKLFISIELHEHTTGEKGREIRNEQKKKDQRKRDVLMKRHLNENIFYCIRVLYIQMFGVGLKTYLRKLNWP